MLCAFPRSALGLGLQRSGWISACVSQCQGSFHAGIQHGPCGEQVLRRRETSCTKLGEREANITIINLLARVSTLLRGVQHKRTENNCLAWGMYHTHDGSMQWDRRAL